MAWSRSSPRSGRKEPQARPGRKEHQTTVYNNEWLVVSSMKTTLPEQSATGRPRSASLRPRLKWTNRPESAMSIRLYDREQQNRVAEGAKISETHQKDGIIVTIDPHLPDCPIIYRNAAAREANPERINLDRRDFLMCPILQDETRLRLLNLENNAIKEISNLTCLPNLIFLDLYNNHITEISGLDCLPSLRVLMLGKNVIHCVRNLSSLQKLDVLDLHSNMIEKITGMETLRELRVLNLAGNTITDIENLSQLSSLTELNLRRNKIFQLDDRILSLSTVSRLFLSHNKISELASIQATSQLQSLIELSLDGNPIAEECNLDYRSSVLEQFPNLKILDGHRISTEERRLVSLFSPKSKGWVSEKPANDTLKGLKATVNGNILDLVESVRSTWMQRALQLSSQKDSPSYHEFHGKQGHLSIYGPCLDVLFCGRYVNIVSISFHFIDFNSCSHNFVSIRDSVPLLKKLSFKENDLHTFYQLDTLSVFHDLSEIDIANNPIVDHLPLYRAYLIFRLPSVQAINSKPIEPKDYESSHALFDPLKVLWKTSSIKRIKGFCQPSMLMADQSSPETYSLSRQLVCIQCENQTCDPISMIIIQTIRQQDSCKFIKEQWPNITTRLLDECSI